MLKPGTRVVRGPDWTSKKQDQEEGFMGTIIFVPKKDSGDHRVTVMWDSGRELRYRAGKDGKYDLRIVDTGPIGVTHPGVKCNGCGDEPIKGIRWTNAVSPAVNLCTICYMDDKDSTADAFVRLETQDSQPVGVQPRDLSQNYKKKRRGIFPDAEVMRGPHWQWKQDEDGESGIVTKLITWGNNAYRGGVEVLWKKENTKGWYRVGGEGSVDVVYKRTDKPGFGGYYYPEHLPLVDIVGHGDVAMKASDKVKVNLTLKNFRSLQEKDNGLKWEDGMKQCMQDLGTIVQITAKDSYIIQYEDSNTWEIHRKALYRIHSFVEGEAVEVLQDERKVRDLQTGHGGWCDDMKHDLGQVGRIVNISPDGDMKVKMASKSWTFSPVCIVHIADPSKAESVPKLSKEDLKQNTDAKPKHAIMEASQMHLESIARLHGELKRNEKSGQELNIVQKASQGDLHAVKEILKKYPEKVDRKTEGKTALQLACYEGNTDVVQCLIEHRADVNKKDDDGDGPLHYAAHGKEFQSMELLLKNKVDVNALNDRGQSALHIAISKASVECVELLVNHNGDLSVQDEDGETPMHYAVSHSEKQQGIYKAILSSKKADFTMRNNNGLNVLHWSVVCHVPEAVELILATNRKIVEETTTNDNNTALHIAAANNYDDIAKILTIKGGCNLDCLDRCRRTPLFICVAKKSHNTLNHLISAGCQVNLQDVNGNTALHVALKSKLLPGAQDDTLDDQIICALIEARSDVHIKNKDSYTPLDFTEDPGVKHFMEKLSSDAHANKLATTKRGIALPLNWEPMKNDLCKSVFLSADAGGMVGLELVSVSQKFLRSLPQANIVQIKRVQNPTLWETYVLCKMRLSTSRPTANEMTLFHASNADAMSDVFQFNIESREIQSDLGIGAYFAKEAKYADKLAKADGRGHKYIFMTKVMLGRVALGDPSYKRPPAINLDDIKSELYDSCVDNLNDPKIYCVYDKNQFYPEYMVEYM